MASFRAGMIYGGGLIAAFLGGYVASEIPGVPRLRYEAPQVSIRQDLRESRGKMPPSVGTKNLSALPTPSPRSQLNLPRDTKENLVIPPLPGQDMARNNVDSGEPDPRDLGFQMVKQHLGIKTTILDSLGPVPEVLVEARAPGDPLPGMQPNPMMGPSPRLEPPPLIVDHGLPRPGTRLMNQRELALTFDLEGIAASRVVAVELWTTRDSGRTWARTDRQLGGASPFRTRLWSDGEYAFRLVFECDDGERTAEPAPGDAGDFPIVLDTTAPRLTLVRVARASAEREMEVEWSAIDERLDHANQYIEVSEDGLCWLEVEEYQTEPTKVGYRTRMRLPGTMDRPRFVRLTARDRAGNAATIHGSVVSGHGGAAIQGRITGTEVPSGPELGPVPRVVD